MKIVAANFKTNHTRATTKEYINKLCGYLNQNNKSEIFVFPTSTSFDNFALVQNLTIGVQNAYCVQNGSYTGEIGLEQLKEFEVKTILLGHSERRHILGETQEQIAQKFRFFAEQNFKIIYCVGEPLEVMQKGLHNTIDYLKAQFIGIDLNYENLILAYEPVWAIGTGVSATLKDIKDVHNEIKKISQKPLLYGGSVKLENIGDICSIENVDGALIGTASLEADNFIKIIEKVNSL